MADPDRLPHGATRRPGWWRLRLVAVVLTVVTAIVLFAVFIVTRQNDPAEGTPLPVTGTPPAVPTEPAAATPESDAIAWPAGSLPALLSIAPDQLGDEANGLPVQVTYANVQTWLESQGLDPDQLSDTDLARAIEPLELPEVLETRGLSADWRAMYGFDLRQVDQVLSVGPAPNQILIMPGRYDAQVLLATWAEHGYQAVEVEEVTVWSLAPGDRIDLSAPASRPALGSMNTVTLLDDGTLIATARQSRMAEALRAVGGGGSMMDNDLLREAATSEDILTSPCVVIASGRLLQQPASVEDASAARATPSGSPVPVESVLPPVDLLLFAMPPGGSEPPFISMTMIYDESPEDPDAVLATVQARVEADPAWSSRYRLASIDLVGEDGDMIVAKVEPVGGQGANLSQLERQDLDPFMWTLPDQDSQANRIATTQRVARQAADAWVIV